MPYPSKRVVGDDGTCFGASPVAVLACFNACPTVAADGDITLVDTGIFLQLISEIQKFASLITSLSAKLSQVNRFTGYRRGLTVRKKQSQPATTAGIVHEC